MIGPGYAQVMARYNAEMNRRMYGAALGLSEVQRREDCGAFFGSIHATLSHLVWGDRTWMARFAGAAMPAGGIGGSVAITPDFSALWAMRQDLDAEIVGWADGLTQADLDRDLCWFSGSMQREIVKGVGELVVHMFNHQTHHRGQVHAMLTRFGAKTGDTDLPFVL